MNELLSIQEEFQNYLLHSGLSKPKFIINTKKVSAKTRLAIYSYAYRSRLIDALADNFPVLKNYLGCENFEALANAYLDIHPSTNRSIRWFGDQLGNFIASKNEFVAMPYLVELARVEWILTEVFDAPNVPVFQLDEIAKIPPEHWSNMRLFIHPSVKSLSLMWNVDAIWQAITDKLTPAEPKQNEHPVIWIFWRKDLINKFSPLTADEAWAITAVLEEKSFAEICEGLCRWHSEDTVAIHAASYLKGWITVGLITKIVY